MIAHITMRTPHLCLPRFPSFDPLDWLIAEIGTETTDSGLRSNLNDDPVARKQALHVNPGTDKNYEISATPQSPVGGDFNGKILGLV